MATPTDPAKRAAYLARKARNQRNYIARQKAAKLGTPVPEHAKLKRPATYRPKSKRANPAEVAAGDRDARRMTRAEFIRQLPDVRNPDATLRPGEERARKRPEGKTRRGQQASARRIREESEANRLQSIGRRRKQDLRSELDSGPQSERMKSVMTVGQQERFRELSERIAKQSQQTIAILFEYAGGASDYSAVFDRVLASPESADVEEGLEILASLAERAEAAEKLYAPKALGRLNF